MAQKKNPTKKTVCSFCIESFSSKDILTVRLPMFGFLDKEYDGSYKTACCKKCIELPEVQKRITEIINTEKK